MKFKRRFRRKFKYNKKRSFMFLFFFLVCLSFGLGYSLIQTDINIFGTTVLKDNRWDVHFDNIQEGEDSVSPTSEPEITDNTTVTFSAKLKNPGEKFEFLIDVVNDGTIDAKIASITLSPELTLEQQNFFSYEVKYESGLDLTENQALDAGTSETIKVTFKYLEQEDNSLYPSSDQTFNVTLTLNYVQGTGTPLNHPYLYNVLMNEAESGGLARKYTGAHHDSFTAEPSKDVYHWYADNNTQGTEVTNKNNVIFAGQCWQMIRTTDTGGVKMIYNGEAIDNKCLSTRGTHVGYASITTQTLSSNYWYGTDYTYDGSNNLFSISGTTEQVIWDATSGPSLIGKYTCKSTNVDGTCATLYYVESYNSASSAYVIPLNSSSHYSQFGTLQYNANHNSISYVGYMYNTIYPFKNKGIMTETMLSSASLETTYWYADSVTWGNPIANRYNLNNSYRVSSSSDYSSLIGKYTFLNQYQTFTNTSVYYIATVNNGTMFYISLSNSTNHNLSDYNHTYTYGDSYTDNGDGTYTINNPTTIELKDWYNNYSNVEVGKYVCKNAVNNTCNEPWYILSTSVNKLSYIKVSDNYKYANGFTWDGEKYILSDDQVLFWDRIDNTNIDKIKNHHYTCWNETGECTTISYIHAVYQNNIYYINITDGKDVGKAIDEMLYNDDVNTINSTIKSGVEAWYKHYIKDYDNYVEDSIFCGDRGKKNVGSNGWNPNGGNISPPVSNMWFNVPNNLGCLNNIDKFSINNSAAHLNYKVGLISYYEMYLLNNSFTRKTGQMYWLSTPLYSSYSHAINRIISTSGDINYNAVQNASGVRPVISLKPKTKYLSGDGSMTNPYVVN